MSVAKVPYMPETFKQRMKRIRLRAGFKSQQDAATAIGCERGTVGMWEAPSSNVSSVGEWLLQTAKAYKVRPAWINDLASTDDGYPYEAGRQAAPQSQSQLERPTMETIHRALDFLEDMFAARDKEFERRRYPLLLAAVVDDMMRPEPPSVVQLSFKYGKTVDEGHDWSGNKAASAR